MVNEHELTAVDEIVSPDYKGGGRGWPPDVKALRDFYERQYETRPDWTIDVQETVEVGGCVVVRAYAGGTVTADEGGRPLDVPAARAVEWLALYRIAEGLITEIQVLSVRDR